MADDQQVVLIQGLLQSAAGGEIKRKTRRQSQVVRACCDSSRRRPRGQVLGPPPPPPPRLPPLGLGAVLTRPRGWGEVTGPEGAARTRPFYTPARTRDGPPGATIDSLLGFPLSIAAAYGAGDANGWRYGGWGVDRGRETAFGGLRDTVRSQEGV